ncbi:MAG: serine/threonine-protein kinase [Archangium sp.]|nr:serine/threonine-protein kinase [Archangium sp.]MDP3575723.1 serine/threonine-protein kinase [Archangium sp.]
MTEREDLGKTLPRTGSSPVVKPGETERHVLPTQSEGRYTLPEGQVDPELGRGGMGRVLTLVDTHLRREVAVKELLLEHTAERSSTGPLLENLFVREARVLALLEHPGVVPVYELGRRVDGTPYYSMRRIRGRSLAAELEACANLDERLALLSHFIDVVQTVGFAHSKSVVHRDLKPENVMVSRFGETQVIDWGLALVGNEPIEGGIIAGTPSYMAPEQAAGVSVDARSDVWALGVMLYELLTGQLPFEGAGPTQILDAVRTSPIPRVKEHEPQAPPALLAVVDKALERDPSRRYQDAGAMADALEAAQRARAPRPVALLITAASLGVLALLFGAWALTSSLRVDDARRDARIAVDDAQRASVEAQATAALAAFRDRDTLLAKKTAEPVASHPLARGVLWLAEERGVPESLWNVKIPAGCSSLAAAGTTVACATLNGLLLFGADGAALGELSIGPRGWQHAVLALNENELVSGGDDRLLHYWDVTAKKELRHVEGFSAPIRSLGFDGTDVLVGLGDGEVMRVTPDGTISSVTKHPRLVSAVAGTPGQVASVSEGLLRVSGSVPMELDRHVGAVAALSSTDLVLGVERSVLVVHDGQASRVSSGHRDDVTAVAVVPADDVNPSRLVSGSADGTVRWWFSDGTLEGMLSGFAPGVQSLTATPDGRLLVATKQRRLEAWRLPARARPADAIGVPSAHAWWPNGGLVSGYRDGHVRRLDPETGEVRELEARHNGPVRGVARVFGPESADSVRFISVGDDGQVLAQHWNGSVEPLDTLVGARVIAVATSRVGDLAAWAADDGTRVLWSLAFNKEIFREKDTLVRSLMFSNDGKTLAVGREDKHVQLLDAATGKETRLLDPIDSAVTALAFSPDGAFLVGGSAEGRVTLWDLGAPRVLRTWNQPAARVSTLDFHSDGKLVAAGSDDGSAWLFSAPDGALLGQVPGDSGDVLLVAFTEDSLLVVGSDRVAHHLHP